MGCSRASVVENSLAHHAFPAPLVTWVAAPAGANAFALRIGKGAPQITFSSHAGPHLWLHWGYSRASCLSSPIRHSEACTPCGPALRLQVAFACGRLRCPGAPGRFRTSQAFPQCAGLPVARGFNPRSFALVLPHRGLQLQPLCACPSVARKSDSAYWASWRLIRGLEASGRDGSSKLSRWRLG